MVDLCSIFSIAKLKCSCFLSNIHWDLSLLVIVWLFDDNCKMAFRMVCKFTNNLFSEPIPPLFHQGNYVTDFKKKTKLFNSFFAKQCSIIQNSSKLLLTLNKKTKNPFQVFLSTVMILQQLLVVLILTKLMATIW